MGVEGYYWDHPRLKDYLKRIPEGNFLFKAKEKGKSMFILISGVVELVADVEGKEFAIFFVEPGQFLGEQAIISERPFVRMFGARAKSNLNALELDWTIAQTLYREDPKLFCDMLMGIFGVAAERLFRANRMVRLLRSSNNVERLASLIIYFATYVSRETPEGKVVVLPKTAIRYYLDMPEYEVTACLEELARRKVLMPLGEDAYRIPDEDKLIAEVPSLADNMPTIPVI